MPNESKLKRLVIGFGVGAALTFGLVFYFFPTTVTTSWVIAFATLLALAVVSALLALTISEGGALTAVDFLPHLAAVLLLGPSGAVVLVLVGQILTDFFVLRKDRYRG